MHLHFLTHQNIRQQQFIFSKLHTKRRHNTHKTKKYLFFLQELFASLKNYPHFCRVNKQINFS